MKGRPSRYKNRTGFVSTKGKSEKFVAVKGKEVIGFMSANLNLHKAKNAKNDEFYTQLTDVAKITKRNDTLQKTIALKKNEKI